MSVRKPSWKPAWSCYRPQDKILMAQTLELISKLLNAVPVYKMKINNFRDDAVTTAYEGMKGDS